MSQTRILYYDLETKDIIKIARQVEENTNHPYYELPFDDVREFIDGAKVQSQYYVKLNPKDPEDFSLLKNLAGFNVNFPLESVPPNILLVKLFSILKVQK